MFYAEFITIKRFATTMAITIKYNHFGMRGLKKTAFSSSTSITGSNNLQACSISINIHILKVIKLNYIKLQTHTHTHRGRQIYGLHFGAF